MNVRIEAVVSTAGNPEEYVGRHIGMELLGRPLTKMVVTFEAEMSPAEIELLGRGPEQPFHDRMRNEHALTVHSVRITRNFQH